MLKYQISKYQIENSKCAQTFLNENHQPQRAKILWNYQHTLNSRMWIDIGLRHVEIKNIDVSNVIPDKEVEITSKALMASIINSEKVCVFLFSTPSKFGTCALTIPRCRICPIQCMRQLSQSAQEYLMIKESIQFVLGHVKIKCFKSGFCKNRRSF